MDKLITKWHEVLLTPPLYLIPSIDLDIKIGGIIYEFAYDANSALM